MAQLGTKQRPAIVHVRTEARAKEVASIFAEHGWQFILGIEPDKTENVADLTRLLKTTKSGQKIAPEKAKTAVPRRKSNGPLRVVQTREDKTRSSAMGMKSTDEKCEYVLDTGVPKLYTIISGALSMLFLVKLLTAPSIWYVVLLFVPLFCFLGLLHALVLNQRVILHGNKITILRRMYTPHTGTLADALYQIIVKKDVMVHFRFRSNNGRNLAQVSPSAYKNGDQLLKQLTAIVDQENIDVDIIEK